MFGEKQCSCKGLVVVEHHEKWFDIMCTIAVYKFNIICLIPSAECLICLQRHIQHIKCIAFGIYLGCLIHLTISHLAVPCSYISARKLSKLYCLLRLVHCRGYIKDWTIAYTTQDRFLGKLGAVCSDGVNGGQPTELPEMIYGYNGPGNPCPTNLYPDETVANPMDGKYYYRYWGSS